MSTIVYPPTGVFGLGRYRTAHLTTIPLRLDEAMRIVDDLDRQGIHVSARVRESGTFVDVTATRPVTTAEEARAIAAFYAKTDARIAFHPAQAVNR